VHIYNHLPDGRRHPIDGIERRQRTRDAFNGMAVFPSPGAT
jgi:hypothetical protein